MDKELDDVVTKIIATRTSIKDISDTRCIESHYIEIMRLFPKRKIRTLLDSLADKGFNIKYKSFARMIERLKKKYHIELNELKQENQQNKNNIFSQEKITSPNNPKQVIINQDKKEENQSQTKTELPVTTAPAQHPQMKISYKESLAETEREIAEKSKGLTPNAKRILAKLAEKEVKQNEKNETDNKTGGN